MKDTQDLNYDQLIFSIACPSHEDDENPDDVLELLEWFDLRHSHRLVAALFVVLVNIYYYLIHQQQ
jgi:hypothetical protein